MNPSLQRRGRRALRKNRFTGLFLFCLVAGLAAYAFMGSPFFTVSRIKVSGLDRLTSEEVVLLSQITPSDNIFRLNLDKVARSIKRSPRIMGVTLRRALPSTVKVEVTERRGVGIIQYSDYFLEVDPSGIPIAIVDDLSRTRLPIITGRRAVGVELGSPLHDPDLVEALKVPASLSDRILWELSEVNASNINDVILYMSDGVKIRWGATMDNKEKAELLTSLIASIKSGKVGARNMDISVPRMPVVTTDGKTED